MSVFRNSKCSFSINSEELVVGDVIRLTAGMVVPADCILIEAGHQRLKSVLNKQKYFDINVDSEILEVNESEVTGDTERVRKLPIYCEDIAQFRKQYGQCSEISKLSNVLYAQSFITSGQGIAVVCAVGVYT